MWTKSQKISGAVLGLAVVAFGVDRWVLSPAATPSEGASAASEYAVARPAKAPAPAATASSAAATPTPASAVNTATSAAAPATASSPVTLASRLSALGTARRFDFEPTVDAFRPCDAWVHLADPPPVAPPADAKGPAADGAAADAGASTKPAAPKIDLAALFVQRHSLTAVMSNQAGGRVIIDGKYYAPGQTIDGFKLTRVDDGKATFTGRGKIVTLRMKSATGGLAVNGATPSVADAR